ncbi:MAG: glycosyltransferase family 4 protein [Vicinamibacterales bacterium]
MRILFLTETVPYPLDSGGRIKTYYTLQALSSVHEVHCHAFIRETAQAVAQEPLQRVAASLTLHLVPRSVGREMLFAVKSLLTGAPYTVVRHFDPSVMRTLEAATREKRFDAVYCDHLSMMTYGLRLALPILHDAHNVEHEIVRRFAGTARGLRRIAAELEWRYVRRYEGRVYSRCSLIYAVSEVDARQIRAMGGPAPRIAVVPIAVDAQSPVPATPWRNGPEVLFVGALNWPPNRDAVQYLINEIWPLVLSRMPSARLTVVGRGALDSTSPNVTFTGWVEDVAPYFAAARVLAVPIRSGSGLRVKILESLARGVPVVATSVGMEGIAARSGEHLIVADDSQSFADGLVRTLQDDGLVRQLSIEGRCLAAERYDRSVIARQLLDTLRDVMGPGGRGDKCGQRS